MAFMQKLFNNSAKKIPILQNKNNVDDSSAKDDDYNEYWEAFESRNIPNTVDDNTQFPIVRVIVRRETNFQNRRTLFDSSNVKRNIIKEKDFEEYSKYDDISGCFGYQVSSSNCENEKDMAEMIFGSLPFNGLDECIKLHRMNGSMIWSLVFKPKYDMAEKESNGSLSSVGSNLQSSEYSRQSFTNKANIRNTCKSDSGLCLHQGNQIQTKQGNMSLSNMQLKKEQVPSVCVVPPEMINCDNYDASISNTINSSSGVVSPVPICSINVIKATTSSISTVSTSVSKTSHSTFSGFCNNDCRKSNRNCQSQQSNRHLTTSLTSSGISVASRSSSMWSTSTQGKNSSQNLLRISSGDLMKRQQRRIRISISLIITVPEDESDDLLSHFSFVQESLYKLKMTCCEFISYKKHFIHGMYEAWMRSMKDANNFFFAERLNTTALRILRNKKDTKRVNSFVSEFVHLRNILDTKDSKFMFSTLLTACLTYNLGWVKRFDKRLMKTVASKNSNNIDDKLDNNSALSKTIILSSDSTILKRLIFVLTYFVRSSSFQNDLYFSENEEDGQVDKVIHDPHLNNEKNQFSNVRSIVNLSSIVDGNKEREYSGQYETSFPCTNADDRKSASLNEIKETEKKVSFVVGAFQDNPNKHEKRCFTKHDNYMKSKNGRNDNEKEEQVLLVSLPKFIRSFGDDLGLPNRENRRKMHDTPFITCGSSIVPGCTIQGLRISDKYSNASSEDLPILRMNEKKELFREACIPCSIKRKNRTTSESYDNGFICIFGDLDTNDVEIHSQKYTSLNHSNSSTLEGYVSLSPLVANTVDSIVAVSKILDVNQVIDHIENSLYAIYCQSILLSTHLLQSENLQTLDQLSKDLDLDRNDIPILMSIASVHTPELTERYKLSFSF